jgi:hypothetical protein
VLHSVYVKRARRCFNPPIVIKDADAIMTKVIRQLMKIRFEIFTASVLRWRLYLAKVDYQKQTRNFEIVVNRASGGLKQAWYRWTHSMKEQDVGMEHANLLRMVSIMHSVFTKRARRCFNPPIVIKDADAIMSKVIKHLSKVRAEL